MCYNQSEKTSEADMEDLEKLIRSRHSVRQYTGKRIPDEIREKLNDYAASLNEESGLNIQIIYDEPECFGSFMAHYGRFEGCGDYISLVGKKAPGLEERCGYYGELLVLKAQELGLNTCWAALTHGKSRAAVGKGETEVIIIALGYGKHRGLPRKSKSAQQVSDIDENSPEWYKRGIEYALLAPTAINQQKFSFRRNGNKVTLKSGSVGPCLKIDLGIVRCHFELGAGKDSFEWEKEVQE